MASVQVFVDDVVRGDLPMVCAKRGGPATGRMTVEAPVASGGGLAWLLVFLGPVGWVVLLVILTRGQERLSGSVPMSDEAAQTIVNRLRVRNLLVVLVAASVVLALLLPAGRVGLLLLAVGSCLAAAGAHIAADLASVRMDLDGSRRWVTLWAVHPEFVAAVENRERARDTVRD